MRSPCPRLPWAATTTRKICGARRRSTPRWSRTTRTTRTFWCWVPGGMVPGSSSSRHLGNIDYSEPIGKEFRAQIEAKFFAHYLKDEPGAKSSGFDLEDTASFQTGSNTWKRYAHFPPAESKPTSLHLEGAGLLSWSGSTATGGDKLCERPGRPRSLSPSAHSADVQRRLAVVQLAHRRSALRDRPQGCGRVEAACAQAGSGADRRGGRRHLCLDDRHGQRHGGQADRRVSRATIPTRRCAATN